MRKYKKLQQSVDESLKHIHNEKLLEALIEENNRVNGDRQKTKQKQFKLIMASSCLAVILIFVIVGCLFLFPSKNDDGTKHYFLDNEKLIESNLEEMSLYTSYINFDKKLDWKISKFIDTIYNDTLYFVAECNKELTFESFIITVIVNKDYKYYGKTIAYDKEEMLDKNKVFFKEEFVIAEEGIYTFNTKAKINTKAEILYIEYKEMRLDKNSNFLSSLKQVLVFKN